MSVEYSKCRICKEKDRTENMLMPCKCGTWVHRSCLNKKRISDPSYYDSCPICGAHYNFEKKKIPEWKKTTEIVLSVVFDLLAFITLFLLFSYLIGKLIQKSGKKPLNISNSTILGSAIVFGILGIIAFIVAIFYLAQNNPFFINTVDCNDENAFVIFIIIGAVTVLTATVYVTYITLKERLEKHKRAIGVKENVVRDYLRGVDNI